MIERTLCPVLVGREAELSTLEDALIEASLGEGSTIVVRADAGLGKSRLATELRARSSRIGCLTVWGDCREDELSLPYLPLVEALAKVLTPGLATEVRAQLGPAARELATLFPEFGTPIAVAESGDPAQARVRLYEAVLSFLRVLARERPVLMVLDDFQWSDAATRGLLDYVAHRIAELPVLVVTAVRSDELHRGHPVSALLQAWRRSRLVQTIELEPLGVTGVGRMVSAALDAPMSAEFAGYVHARSEGNPFVVEELLREAIDRHDVYRVDGGWQSRAVAQLSLPRVVSEAILLRVERLSEDDVALLQAAAVLGRGFDHATLVSVTRLDAETILSGLQTCVRHQLLIEDAQSAGRFRFRHALTQEAIYDDMILPLREELHLRAAKELRDRGAPLAEIAEHLLRGGRVDDAVPSCLQAGDDALARNAPDVAAALFERALPYVTDTTERARLMARIGEAYWRGGDVKVAQRFLGQAMGEFERVADVSTMAHLHVLLGNCEVRFPSATHYEAARTLLEELGPSEDLAAVYLRLAIIQANDMAGDAALDFATRALETADAAGAPAYRIWAMGALGVALTTLGRVDEALELLESGYSEAMERGYYWIARAVLRNMLAFLSEDLRKPDIAGVLRRWRALPGHSDEHEAFARIYEAEVLAAAGQMAELQASITAAMQLMGDGDYQLAQLRLLHAIETDRLDEAAAIAAALTGVQAHGELWQGQYRMFLGHLAIARDDRVAAAAAGQWALSTPARNVWAEISDTAVASLLCADRLDDARSVLESEHHFSGPARDAFLARANGRVEIALGRPGAAVAHLSRAASLFAETSERRNELRTLLLLADAYAAAGDQGQARRCLGETLAVAEAIGLALVARLARQRATSHGMHLQNSESGATEAATEIELRGASTSSQRTGTLVVARFMAEPGSIGAASVSAYVEWAKHHLATHDGDVIWSSADAVAALFPGRRGEGSREAIQALRAALSIPAKAKMSEVAVGLNVVDGVTASGARALAAGLKDSVRPGHVVFDAPSRALANTWLAERGVPRSVLRDGIGAPLAETPPALRDAFHREGEFWSLAFSGHVVRLKDSKGLQDIAVLLANPGKDLAAVDLIGREVSVPRRASAVAAGLGLGMQGDAGEMLDATARAAYRERVQELEEELAEAEANNDPERAGRIGEEREMLLAELRSAIGLTGRPRRALDPSERARKAVTGRVRDAIQRIEAAHPALGRHLRRSVSTGSLCVYQPVDPVDWQL